MKHSESPVKQQQNEAILLAKSGNQDAFERLLDEYRPLICSLVSEAVKEHPFSISDYEDLYQEALILFYRALKKYDTKQDVVAFGLFAKICIRNGLKTQAKKLQKRLSMLSLEDDETTKITDELNSEKPGDRLMEEESYLQLYDCVRTTLSSYENRIWWLYLSGRTAKEIAVQLEKNEKSVQNAIFRIRRKLRNVIPHP